MHIQDVKIIMKVLESDAKMTPNPTQSINTTGLIFVT